MKSLRVPEGSARICVESIARPNALKAAQCLGTWSVSLPNIIVYRARLSELWETPKNARTFWGTAGRREMNLMALAHAVMGWIKTVVHFSPTREIPLASEPKSMQAWAGTHVYVYPHISFGMCLSCCPW